MPLECQRSKNHNEAEDKVEQLTVDNNSLTEENEILHQEVAERDETIKNFRQREQAKLEATLQDYVKKTEEKAITDLAKGFGMLSKGQLIQLSKILEPS